jgi:hypothetical protein
LTCSHGSGTRAEARLQLARARWIRWLPSWADRSARDIVVDLAALGVTRLAWLDSLVEDWHILGRLRPSELMRANAAVTRLVR